LPPIEFATAEETSVETFRSVSAGSPYERELGEYTEALLERGNTRPAWCLVALDAGEPVARVALWSMSDVPTDLVLIDGDLGEPAQAVLGHAHDVAAGLGASELTHHLDSPPSFPQYQEHDAARVELLTGLGYELLRDGLRWRSDGTLPRAEPSALTFRALTEVGEDAFVEAIAATYEGTPDTWLSQMIDERGALGAAREDFDASREMEFRPEWWELAYAGGDAPAGVIMAANIPGAAVIAYVGVMPGYRGRGLAVQLVRRGTEQLVRAGAEEIRGDCDRANAPMAKAFERAGYENFARRRSYRRML
jgi:ribosomal protein S18 acetylase RimI-like enzyme